MVKSIIKRIIVGVGIALCLMAIKDGGLIGNVQALSCDAYQRRIVHPIDSFVGYVPNANENNVSYYRVTPLNNQSSYKIYFDTNADYMEVLVPTMYTYTFQMPSSIQSGSTMITQDVEGSPPACYIEDNTNNANNNSWTQATYDNVFFRVRYYKKDFNTNYISFTALRFTTPAFHVQQQTNLWLSVNGYFNVEDFKCDSNAALQQSIEENTQAVEDVNNSLNDESDASTSSFLQDIQQDYSNNPVSDLITMPITFLQALNNNVGGSCITWNLGSLLGTNLTMPCINLSNILGSWLYNLIDMAICLFLAYNIGLMCVTIWNNITSLKDDFDDMYSPKHAYNGKHTGGDS